MIQIMNLKLGYAVKIPDCIEVKNRPVPTCQEYVVSVCWCRFFKLMILLVAFLFSLWDKDYCGGSTYYYCNC